MNYKQEVLGDEREIYIGIYKIGFVSQHSFIFIFFLYDKVRSQRRLVRDTLGLELYNRNILVSPFYL